MLSVLLQGTLAFDPERRTSASGKPFATCSVRVPADEGAIFVSVIAFADVADRLLAHVKGDSVAIVGRAALKAWAGKDGNERHGLSVVAEQILSHYELGKRRDRMEAALNTNETTSKGRANSLVGRPMPNAEGGFGDMADDLPWAGPA